MADGDERTDFVAAVTEDGDEMLRCEVRRGPQRVPDQRSAGDRMQHLGDRRLHPGARTRREHDDRRDLGLGVRLLLLRVLQRVDHLQAPPGSAALTDPALPDRPPCEPTPARRARTGR